MKINMVLMKFVTAIEFECYGYIQYLTMDNHEALSPGVYCTTFSDGTQTVCNYSDKPFCYKGVGIAPESWHIFEANK